MVTIEVTAQDLENARELEQQVMRMLPQRRSYTGFELKDRYRNGYVGEFVAVRWLRSHDLPVVHRIKANGRSQPSEILVDRHRVDAKTRTTPLAQEFMTPEAKPIDFDYVISLHWIPDNDRAWIRGALTAEQVRALPVRTFPPQTVPTRWKPFRELPISPQDLVELLRA